MMELLHDLAVVDPSRKVILVVIDGLGGLSMGKGTELQVARTPHLDRLAAEGVSGLADPVAMGIAPGSGPAHLALFGYDPLKFEVGRGVLSALGVDFPIQHGDVAARMNFATMDKEGKITDRRAGRIPTEEGAVLCRRLESEISLSGVELHVLPEKEYRAAFVMRGEGLNGKLNDTDPQRVGLAPLDVTPHDTGDQASVHTAELVKSFLSQAREVLSREQRANIVLMRGFDTYRQLPDFQRTFGFNPGAIAVYPMYRGVARLVGMKVLPAGQTMAEEVTALSKVYEEHDYFFLHFKYADSRGEDGDFNAKVKVLEEIDGLIPQLIELNPACLAVTGDHSTPAAMRSHSFHPVPVVIRSKLARVDGVKEFNEIAAITGGLGRFPMVHLMSLLMAHAGRLAKYGA